MAGLTPGGRKTLQKMENLLLRVWGALWGWIFHRDPEVYTYIAESLAPFPDRQKLSRMFQSQGFEVHSSTLHLFGIMQSITLRKANAVPPIQAQPEPS